MPSLDTMIDLRQVGSTGLSVTSLSLGCASIGNLGTAVTDAEADGVLRYAWDAGIRYFDTAPHYGRGRSEQRLGRFLSTQPRSDTIVSTKVGRVLRPGPHLDQVDGFVDPLPNAVHYDYSAAGFEESLEGSLQRLGTDRVDIVLVHDIGAMTHGADGERHYDDLLTSGLPYLDRLKANGLVGAIGLGVNETAVCLRLLQDHSIDVILLAGRWTLLDRDAEADLVPLCLETGTSLILGGVFNSGILATGAIPGALFNYALADEVTMAKVRLLQFRCHEDGIELPQAALQFVLTRPGVSSVLIGTSNVEQLARNLALANQPIAPASLARLLS